MIQEYDCHTYHQDPQYTRRQAELRRIERAIEGYDFPGGKDGAAWKKV